MPYGLRILAGIIVILLIRAHILRSHRTELYVSKKYPISFRVNGAFSNSRVAAAKMEKLISEYVEFLDTIKGNKHKNRVYERAVSNILRYFNPDVIKENNPNNLAGDTSYVIGQGIEFSMCIRQPDGTFVDPDVMKFVMLHEVSHISLTDDMYPENAVDRSDHSDLFWRIFKYFLQEAATTGFLKPIDYSEHPKWYCGMYLDQNPLFDSAIIV